MDYFVLKNTNDHSRNFAPYLEKYFSGLLGASDRHVFVHDNRSMFHAFTDGRALNIIHAGSDPKSYTTDGKPFATLSLENLATLLKKLGAIHFVAVDVPTKITDIELLGRMRFAYQDPAGIFLDVATDQPLTQTESSPTVAILSAFRSPAFALNTIFLHYPFAAVKNAPPYKDDKHSVRTVLENESLKETVFPFRFEGGTRAVIDRHFVFCDAGTVKIKVVADEYLQLLDGADPLRVFHIDTKLNWKYLAADGAIEVDLGKTGEGTSHPFSVKIASHDFLLRWIYEEQRFEFDFLLHRV